MLFKPAESPISHSSVRQAKTIPRTHRHKEACRQFSATPHRAEGVPIQRYGKVFEHKSKIEDKEASRTLEGPTTNASAEQPLPEVAHEEVKDADAEPRLPTTTSPPTPPNPDPTFDLSPALPPDPAKSTDPKAPDSVLHIPTTQQEEETKPPHLKTPPYVHHFDTYGLVRKLSQSHYTPSQSITIMKAVRQTLLTNMALARAGLVSKSNVENETYLFRAACSELKTEIGNRRRGEMERMRSDRNQLQHELDILGQRLGQETSGLREELKGLFDDRKMAVRQEQRSMESKVTI